MKKLFQNFLFFCTTFSILHAHEGPWSASRPDGHAPITVMGDHMHAKGEWMLSYRNMTMDMEGMLKGSDTIAATSAGYGMMGMMLPKEMRMDMHMQSFQHISTYYLLGLSCLHSIPLPSLPKINTILPE